MDNKTRIKSGLKMLGLAVWILVAIATSSFVWSAGVGVLGSVVAGANLLCAGFGVYREGKKVTDEK